ncbi:MAG: hypothetical protein KDJ77_20025 [Rhodobiaceae bacterium]|nr:hypothetical protein [Rhodobiaceae bacterium]
MQVETVRAVAGDGRVEKRAVAIEQKDFVFRILRDCNTVTDLKDVSPDDRTPCEIADDCNLVARQRGHVQTDVADDTQVQFAADPCAVGGKLLRKSQSVWAEIRRVIDDEKSAVGQRDTLNLICVCYRARDECFVEDIGRRGHFSIS